MNLIEAFLLGLVEGLTEFLPISSTGHLILVSHLIGISQSEFHKSFEIVIQLGSILAVVMLFWREFLDKKLLFKLFIAFLPTGLLGFLLYKHIKSLFDIYTVAYMLIFGGIAFIIIEILYKNKEHKITTLEQITHTKALAIGFFQSLSMIPGTSRSGATIIGGLLLGLDRKMAAKFSFLLAVPTMFIASGYDIYKNYSLLNLENLSLLTTGFITAFIFAMIAIKVFLSLISKIGFIPFGIYRILLGSLFLIYFS